MAKTVSEKTAQTAIDQLDFVRGEWLRRPGVTAVDVGFKIRNEKLTEDVALRVHVERKLPLEALEKREVFTKSGSPEKVGGFPIDVIEASYVPARRPAPIELAGLEDVDRTERIDPLVGGISVGNPRITAGTLGAIVWDRTDGSVCLLSNWHVLAGSPDAAAGEPILQPGSIDGGTPADTVATLARSRLDSDMDAAIARLNGARGYSRDIAELAPIAGIVNPALGMQVRKSGRTTGLTDGVIDGLSFSGAIGYDHGPNMFHGQIHIVPRPPWPSIDYETSKGGDSGSVWIDEATGKAVGLHYGGELTPAPASEMALANPMYKVAASSGLNFSFSPLFRLALTRKGPWEDVIADFPRRFEDPVKARMDPIKLAAGLDIGGGFDPRSPVVQPPVDVSRREARAPFAFTTPHHFGAPAPGEDGSHQGVGPEELDALIHQFQDVVADLDSATRGYFLQQLARMHLDQIIQSMR